MRKRWITMIVAAAMTVVAACHEETRASIINLHAVDDGSAILVLRTHDSYPFRDWVSSVSASGRARWSVRLPGEYTDGLVNDGVVVGDGVVAVRYLRERGNELDEAMIALSLDDGGVLWERVLRTQVRTGGPPPGVGPDLHTPGRFIVILHGPSEILSLDVNTGAVVWRRSVGLDPSHTTIVGDAILVEDEYPNAVTIGLRSGVTARIPQRGSGCVVGDEYVVLDRVGEKSALIGYWSGDPRTKRVVTLMERFDEPGVELTMSKCGRYAGGLAVWLVETVDRKSTETVVVLNHELSLSRVIPLGPTSRWWFGGAPIVREPLTRFVPHVQPRSESDRHRLVVLDLEDGAVSERDVELGARVVKQGGQWLVSATGEASSLDGATGAWTARSQARFGVRERPGQTAGGRIWLYASERRSFDAPAIAVIDPRTLVPTYNGGVLVIPVAPPVMTRRTAP